MNASTAAFVNRNVRLRLFCLILTPVLEAWLKLNADMAAVWPNIARQIDPPADADDFRDVTGKFDKYFSKEPGKGA